MSGILLVGLDLCSDFTQIACRHPRMAEPESVGRKEGEEAYLIPTCLAIREDTRDWIYGNEAVRLVEEGAAVTAGDLLGHAAAGEAAGLCGVRFLPEDLLERYIRKVLLLLKEAFPDDTIRRLTVTFEEQQAGGGERVKAALLTALQGLGLSGRSSVRSHKDCFLQYILGEQRAEAKRQAESGRETSAGKLILPRGDAALFEFREGGLRYVQLEVNRRTSPMVADVRERDFTEYLKLSQALEKPEEAAGIFKDLSGMAVHRQPVSVIYAVGRGFEGDWADQALGGLCVGRKVFKGQNLYAKGACYAAIAEAEGLEGDVLFLGEDRIYVGLSMEIYQDGILQELELARPAAFTEEAGGEWDFILDRMQELTVTSENFLTRKKEEHHISLEWLPAREPKLTRIRMSVQFANRDTCRICIRSMGFGEFAPVEPGEEGIEVVLPL